MDLKWPMKGLVWLLWARKTELNCKTKVKKSYPFQENLLFQLNDGVYGKKKFRPGSFRQGLPKPTEMMMSEADCDYYKKT